MPDKYTDMVEGTPNRRRLLHQAGAKLSRLKLSMKLH